MQLSYVNCSFLNITCMQRKCKHLQYSVSICLSLYSVLSNYAYLVLALLFVVFVIATLCLKEELHIKLITRHKSINQISNKTLTQ